MRRLSLSLVLLGSLMSNVWANEPAAPPVASTYNIGYLTLDDAVDKRYSDKTLFAKYLGQSLGRPEAGAETALKEVKYHGAALGVTFAIEVANAKTEADLTTQVTALQQKGIKFILADLPASALAELAKATRDQEIALLNVSAADDSLRQTQCQPNLYHLIPNHAMQTDSLAQYLVSHKWTKVLQLTGPLPADQQWASAFERSAKKFGLKITETKPFVLSNDPRERDQNNIALLTHGEQDVIFVADSHGEFARNIPYHTLNANLVVGAEGLTASAWHWAWERHGAPQLEKRFEKKAERPMGAADWAAWMGVKVIAEAVQTRQSTDFKTLLTYLMAKDTTLDGFKGTGSSFRPWDHQLRQPMLLHTHNWVVERAPLKGFLHQINNLDTLGFDERDSECHF